MKHFNRDFNGRFGDRVERDLNQIADRATPSSSTAWEAIQQRIDEQDPTERTMEVIMLDPEANRLAKRPRTGMLVAASVAALTLVGGLVIVANRDGEPAPANQPEPTPTVPATDPAIAGEPTPTVEELNGEALPSIGADVESGVTYQTGLLGVSMSFEVPETTTVRTASANVIVLNDSLPAESPYPADSRTLSFTRISGWNTPEESADPEYFGPGSIDPYEIDAWAEANGLVATIPPCCRTITRSDAESTRVGSRIAERNATLLNVELESSDTNQTSYCHENESCLWAASVSERGANARIDNDPLISTGQINRFMVITIEGEDPLLIHASTVAGDEEWLEVMWATGRFELGTDAPPAAPTTTADQADESTLDTAPTGDEVADAPVGAVAGRDAPVPAGEIADIGEGYRLQVLSVTEDATDEVAARSESASPPPEGSRYTLVNFAAGYYGVEDLQERFLANVRAFGADGEQLDQDCGTFTSFGDEGRSNIFAGGVIQADLCIVTTPADADGLVIQAFGESGTDNSFLDASTSPVDVVEMPTLAGPRSGATSSEARRNATAVGTPAGVDTTDWSITVTASAVDITDVVASTDGGNAAPPEGFRFIGVPVSMEHAATTDKAAFGANARAVGDSNIQYGSDCGVVPDALDVFTPVAAGVPVSGQLCFVVPTDEVDSMTMYAGRTFADVFFAT